MPALIETFSSRHRENEPKTVRDLMDADQRYVGSFFALVEDSSDWIFKGATILGKPHASPINNNALLVELDPNKEIKLAF